MTPDQVSAAKKWAFELATERLFGSRDFDIDGHDLYRFDARQSVGSPIPVDELPPSSQPAFVRAQEVIPLAYDDTKGKTLITNALKGDLDAEAVLYEFAGDFLNRGCPLPEHLAKFVAAKLYDLSYAKVRKRGRNKHANAHRNYYIYEAVSELLERGFSATRNAATESPSACSIVSEALRRHSIDLSEYGVAKVWNTRPPSDWSVC